jgi:hypothetical protein
MIDLLAATLICTGMAPSTPPTNIEVEIRPGKYSTIRYEIAEGSLAGTAYVQSIGHMIPRKTGSAIIFQSGDGPNATILVVENRNGEIQQSHFTHYISDMKNSPMDCSADL